MLTNAHCWSLNADECPLLVSNAVALMDKLARHALLAITSPFGDPATAFNAQKAQLGTVRGLPPAWHARQELTQVRI
jgi:hypothetical protein